MEGIKTWLKTFQYKVCYSKIEIAKENGYKTKIFQYKICYSKIVTSTKNTQSTQISIQNLL